MSLSAQSNFANIATKMAQQGALIESNGHKFYGFVSHIKSRVSFGVYSNVFSHRVGIASLKAFEDASKIDEDEDLVAFSKKVLEFKI